MMLNKKNDSNKTASNTKKTTNVASIKAVALAAIGRDNSLLEKEKEAWKKNTRIWQGVCGLLLAGNILLASNVLKPETVYFAQVTNGKFSSIVPLQNLSTPHVNNGQVINFAAEAASVALTHSFLSWKKDLVRFDEYFLPKANNELKQSLVDTGFFKRLEDTASNITAVPVSAPIIVGERSIADNHQWRLQFEMLISWKGQVSLEEKAKITMVVSQVQTYQNPRGIMVESININ